MGVSSYVIAGLIALAGATYGVQAIRINGFEDDIALLESQLATEQARNAFATTEMDKLRNTINQQNEAISNHAVKVSDLRKAMFQIGKDMAARLALANQRASDIAAAQGESCEEGISLIDEALGL